MSPTISKKLVTIVIESDLEHRLVKELLELGASGYTCTEARGEGSRNVRSGSLPGENVRINVIASQKLADKIVNHIAEGYFSQYAVACYMTEVEVMRGEKYV
jgi:nitrogen regulatory protein PII